MTFHVLLIGVEETPEFKGLDVKIEKTIWNFLKSLHWYDMIIVDNFSVNSKTIRIATKTKDEFHEFIDHGGILVCLCCTPKNYSGYKSYTWLPILSSSEIEIIANKADSLKIKRSPLERFLEQQKDNINIECFFKFKNKDIPNSVITMTTGLEEVTSFFLKLGKGQIICLPQFKNKELFLKDWLEFWVSRKPSWVEKYQYKEKKVLKEKIKTINMLEKLLYGNARELCKAVAEVFRILGFKVTMSSKGAEPDLYISYDDFMGIVEVKGLKTHATRDDMRALLDYYDANVNKQPKLKGIFIVNHYCGEEPKIRDKPYTNEALKLAQSKGFCLITTVDLYFMMEKALSDPNLQENARKKIMNEKGFIRFNQNLTNRS